MDLESIFNSISFNLKPNDDYRKAYLFRIKKGFYKLLDLEKNLFLIIVF